MANDGPSYAADSFELNNKDYAKKTLDDDDTKNINTQKRNPFQQNTSNVFSTWHLAESDITSHLILNPSSQLLYPKQQDTLKRDITIFSQIHEINFECSL